MSKSGCVRNRKRNITTGFLTRYHDNNNMVRKRLFKIRGYVIKLELMLRKVICISGLQVIIARTWHNKSASHIALPQQQNQKPANTKKFYSINDFSFHASDLFLYISVFVSTTDLLNVLLTREICLAYTIKRLEYQTAWGITLHRKCFITFLGRE